MSKFQAWHTLHGRKEDEQIVNFEQPFAYGMEILDFSQGLKQPMENQ